MRFIIVRTACRPISKALAPQQVAQHPAACKRVFQMQTIDPAHDHKFATDTGQGV